MILLGRALLDVLFPPLCHLCKTPAQESDDLHLCPSCREAMAVITAPFCSRCGIPFAPSEGIVHLCGPCLSAPPPFQLARAALRFSGPVRELVHQFKYNRKVHLAQPLALLTSMQLQEYVTETGVELVLPVPLHVRRLRERTFNQSILIGELCARAWNLPLVRHNLRRIRWTEPQTTLSSAERKRNVRGAFSLRQPEEVKGRKVMLIDDVYTTGSTVGECSRVLLEAGADAVVVITTARAAD